MSTKIPLRRLVVEAVVIFVGVFSAFAADAWWDVAKDRASAEQQLAAVESELEYNIGRLDLSVQAHTRVAEAGLRVLNLTGPGADSASQAEVLKLIPLFYSTPNTDLRTSAITRALDSGAFEMLGLSELGKDFESYPGSSSGLQAHEDHTARLMEVRVWPRLWLHVPQLNIEVAADLDDGAYGGAFSAGVPARSRFAPDAEGLLADMAFENAVVERTTLLQIAAARAENGRSASERRLQALRAGRR